LKYICRSSTVASWGEVYSRSGVDRLLDTGNRTTNQVIIDSPTNPSTVTTDLDGPPNIAIEGAAAAASSNVEVPQQQNIFDKLRGADIDLLKILDVSSIVNLMVEKRKIMFGVK
jgi:myotubularin-related protein 14